MTTSRLVVRAPATSANLGPGFDCLGMALDLWNEVELLPEGEPTTPDNLIARAARRVFDESGKPAPPFALRCTNAIPFARGLGSSAAAIVSGVLLAKECLGVSIEQAALLRIVTELEGHPDNVVACLLGGIRVTTRDKSGLVLEAQVPLALSLRALVFVPDQMLETTHARRVLPDSVPRSDALFNVARAALLVAALAGGRKDLLAEASRDRLHQPYRLPLFPAGADLLEAAQEAGALGAYVSGAGPSIVALCQTAAEINVRNAYASTAQRLGIPGSVLPLDISPRGAHLVP